MRNQEHDICLLKDLTKQFTKDFAKILSDETVGLVYRGEIGEIEKTPGKNIDILRYLAENHQCDIFPFTISGNRGMLLSR